MGHRRPRLERELQQARAEREAWVKVLESRGVAADAYRRDPVWRQLNARCRRLSKRLRAAGELERIDAELQQRGTDG